MSSRCRIVRIVVPTILAALELSHPSWSEGAVSQAVLAAGGWWIPLHLFLLVGYGAMVYVLWLPGRGVRSNGLRPFGTDRSPPEGLGARWPRIALMVFLVCNTAFLGADGVGVGLRAPVDPDAADRLWNSPLVTALANLTGAAWAASLLAVAAVRVPGARGRVVLLGLGLTWLTFVASAPPLGLPSIISRLIALATGAWVVYAVGPAGLSFALLVFAAVLHQHVGAEAALGLVLVGIALARRPEAS